MVLPTWRAPKTSTAGNIFQSSCNRPVAIRRHTSCKIEDKLLFCKRGIRASPGQSERTSPAYAPGVSFGLVATPLTDAFGEVGDTADLLFLDVPATSDVTANGMMYGSIAAGTWATIVDVRALYSYRVQLPGTNAGADVIVGLGAAEPLSFAQGPIVAELGLVTNPRIDAMTLFQPQQVGVGPHAVTWSPPTLGAVSEYQLSLNHLVADADGSTQLEPVAVFTTPHTSVALPAAMMVTGESHVMVVSALSGAALPARYSFVGSDVVTVTGAASFTPPAQGSRGVAGRSAGTRSAVIPHRLHRMPRVCLVGLATCTSK